MATISRATVRVMRSYDYCNFEVTAELESPVPITMEEMDTARQQLAILTDQAVDDYKEQKARERVGEPSYEYTTKKLKERLANFNPADPNSNPF